jgi:hypothetical protein
VDTRFHPAIAAINSGDADRLRALITADAALATSRHNLRIAAGLGRTDVMDTFFADDGSLRPQAGTVNWPWGDLDVIERSNFDRAGKDMLAAKFASFANDRQGIVNNAFVYACMHGHVAAAPLRKGCRSEHDSWRL